MAASSKNEICPDWIYLGLSNVHVAKDRDWFTSYTPFESTLEALFFGSNMPVLGIGTVHIPVKQHASSTSTTLLELEDVLHVPSFACNAIGPPILDTYGCSVVTEEGTTSKGTIRDELGQQVAYFLADRPDLILAIGAPAGKQLGPPVIVGDETWKINCLWHDTERKKWEDFQKAQKNETVDAKETGDNSEYSDAEKDFLKQHWGSEYKFFVHHKLRVYKEEDRAEGRAILRALMSKND